MSVKRKKAAEEQEYFVRVIDQQKVDDITVDFFYRSHTASLLVLLFIGLLLIAFTRNDNLVNTNCYHGALAVGGIFLAISTMVLPNGPFTRPHPIIWRIIFGASLLYFLLLVFVLFMRLEDVKAVLYYIDPNLKNMTINDILDKEYAVNCSEITWARIYSHLDIFAVAHFLGWVVKAVLIRHYYLTWLISISWEITELAHCHMMPNFCECWWDSIILDIIVCNGFGIYIGMKIVRWLEMRAYHWESIRSIQSTTGKIKRIMLQFTPASWEPTKWFDHNSTFKRGILLSILVFFWQFAELNSFFMKHVFVMKPSHPLTLTRLGLITLISAPGIKQFYMYVTDPMINRMGSQLWMFLAVVMTEFVVCFKFGYETFEKTIILYMVIWVFWLVCSSVLMVFLCIWISSKFANNDLLNGSNNKINTLNNIINRKTTNDKTTNISLSSGEECDMCEGSNIKCNGYNIINDTGGACKLLARVVKRVSGKWLKKNKNGNGKTMEQVQVLELHPVEKNYDEAEDDDAEEEEEEDIDDGEYDEDDGILEDGDVIRCRVLSEDFDESNSKKSK